MAKIVQEIMNRELFSLRPGENEDAALQYILALDITAAPVVDEAGVPRGVVSLRDLVTASENTPVEQLMSAPAVSIPQQASIEQAARVMSEHFVHHLVVVDEHGHARGMVSTLDVIRGLLGLPAAHPDQFPHFDKQLGVTWCNDTLLATDNVDAAPNGPGVFALVSGGKGLSERVVWGEASGSVRSRLLELCSLTGDEDSVLFQILERGSDLRFRAASVPSPEQRRRLAQALMAEARRAYLPRTFAEAH
jgi:CBS domain-containing protein